MSLLATTKKPESRNAVERKKGGREMRGKEGGNEGDAGRTRVT